MNVLRIPICVVGDQAVNFFVRCHASPGYNRLRTSGQRSSVMA